MVFVNPEKGVSSAEQALSGARDIMAEWMSEDARARSRMRSLYQSQGIIRSAGAAGKGEDAAKYRDYLDRSEPISRLRPHRILAMLRGAKSGALSLHIAPPEQAALGILEELFIKGDGPLAQQVRQAAMDSYRRLLAPSMENETLSRLRLHAGEKAIEIFSQNLRQALLEPPLGQKSVLALDPGFRTGCKLAVIDSLGRLQENQEIFPHDTGKRREEAAASVRDICKRRGIEAIAVGNGTAGRETEEFLRGLDLAVPIIMVNESGASVYSTSEIARREFPHKDATVRSAVSIGRRLMDPLAELVKIDPKAIGVGEYQHDVDQSALKSALDDVAASCVNLVGVDLNTASRELLAYVSGLGLKTAEAVVNYRNEHGLFRSRKDLLKVPRLGPKAFEQSAGFLRIHNGDNPLDGTAVHPESYPIVEKMAEDCGVGIRELMNNEDLLQQAGFKEIHQRRLWHWHPERYYGGAVPAGKRPEREVRCLQLCSGDKEDGGPSSRNEASRHCDQCYRLRGFCGHRRTSGGTGSHQPASRQLCQESNRSGQGQTEGHCRGAGCGFGEEENIAVNEASANQASRILGPNLFIPIESKKPKSRSKKNHALPEPVLNHRLACIWKIQLQDLIPSRRTSRAISRDSFGVMARDFVFTGPRSRQR